MAACTHGFRAWLEAFVRLFALPVVPASTPDYSSISMPVLDAQIAEMDALRAVHLDAAEDLQRGIEILLEEKAFRIAGVDTGMTYERTRPARASAYA